MQSLLEQLQALPDAWGLVAVGSNKRPYLDDWQHQPLDRAAAAQQIITGTLIADRQGNERLVKARAIGVLAGPASGGLLFVDHDGISATEVLERIGAPLRDLPKSIAVTSGRDGRFQIIYRVPEQFWPAMVGRRVIKSGKTDPEGNAEQLELRWAGHQSVVIGAHPTTSGYRWLKGRAPWEQALADAPMVLIEQLLDQPEPELTPLLTQQQPAAPPPSGGGTIPLLEFITRDSRALIETGGTPGSWNDDQLALSLDVCGTEAWILAHGHRPDISAREAFELHITAAKAQARDFDARKAWHRFDGALARNPTPGTPTDKLRDRLRFHTRHSRPLLPPPPRTTPGTPAAADQPYAPALAKPTKLEAGELLAMLRMQAQGGRIRFNTFSQQLEIDGGVIEGAERFYLRLAEQGFKVAKDLALDCLVQVARENPYDPVALYLDHVASTVEPIYIGGLATGYLRPEDAAAGGGPTLYDHMLRCTLIGAVRRVFEPGCKHDTACVLMGSQGARKSSFWSALGGAFFSDALGDISSKDDLMVLHRSWVMEWAELDHLMSRKHAGQIKSFLSQSTDLFRVPYGRATEAFPRRGIIVGSTNRSTGFLVDDTGNRRFWVIPITRTEAAPIDTPTLLAERDAIWSAAVHAYRAGEDNYLPPELAQQVTTENETYLIANPWQAPIQAWLKAPANSGKTITSELLLTEAIARPIERQTRADQMQVGQILRELGFIKRRQLVDGNQKWVFQRT
jgi:hypothetical protein